MFKNIKKILIIVFTSMFVFTGILISTQSNDNEEKGREIMEKADSTATPKNQIAHQFMIIQKGNNKYTKQFDIYSKEVDDNTSYTLVDFIHPAKIKFLTYSHKDKDDEIWIKMGTNSPRKISGAGSDDEGGDYMGSHISYDDMEEYDFDSFRYKYIATGKINGEEHHLIEQYKKDNDWTYSKVRSYVRVKDNLVTATEMYNKDGEKYKKMTIDYVKIGKYNIPALITVKLTNRKNQWTAFGINKNDDGKYEIEVDVSDTRLPDSTFNKDSM